MRIDKRPALEALQVTEDVLDELLLEFVELAREEMRSIRAALGGTEFAAVDRHAHSLAGMAANLRLDRCWEHAKELESGLLSGDLARSKEILALLEGTVDEVHRSISPA